MVTAGEKYLRGLAGVSITNLPNPKTEAKQFMIKDNMKKALETILHSAENQKDIDLENDCVLQLSRLNGLEKQKNEGTISEADYKLEKARIRKTTQDLIGKMV